MTKHSANVIGSVTVMNHGAPVENRTRGQAEHRIFLVVQAGNRSLAAAAGVALLGGAFGFYGALGGMIIGALLGLLLGRNTSSHSN
jgi:membrane associated rhomboid family serine protease